MYDDTTVIICCAGMGTRLGIGTTKALININNKPLILYQLDLLKEFKDIRIVVGYDAQKVIDTVTSNRKDIMFAFNYDYETTGPAASVCKALLNSKKYVLILDGDLLIKPDDFLKAIENKNEFIGITKIFSEEPVLIKVEKDKAIRFAKDGNFEWSGIAKIKSSNLKKVNDYVYNMIKDNLPIDTAIIERMDIDTSNDYENTIEWLKNSYK